MDKGRGEHPEQKQRNAHRKKERGAEGKPKRSSTQRNHDTQTFKKKRKKGRGIVIVCQVRRSMQRKGEGVERAEGVGR